MRILVTGPRIWTDFTSILDTFVKVYYSTRFYEITLIEGEAVGFDSMARIIGVSFRWNIEPYPVNWYTDGRYNRHAAHERNQAMVDSGADLAIAGIMECNKVVCRKPRPHITHGTDDCINRIMEAGIPLKEIKPR